MKIGFLSDLHITNNSNFIEHAVNSVYEVVSENKVDKLFLAGDTSNNYKMTFEFIERLSELGIDTYTILGNHEYWSTDYEQAKLLNNDKYLHGKSLKLTDDVVVIGIDGFFDYSFVTEVDNKYTNKVNKEIFRLRSVGERTFDLSRMKIKKKDYEETFNHMKELLINQLEANLGKQVIVFMHHVPHQNFIVYNDDKIWTSNNSFMGSKKFHEIFKEHKVNKVIFGHTHKQFSDIIDNVQYFCNPVGYRNYEFQETFQERVKKMLKIIEV